MKQARIIFWNVAGYTNAEDIIDKINENDIILICETWKIDPPKRTQFFQLGFEFVNVPATKEAKKVRAKGGMGSFINKYLYKPSVLHCCDNYMFIRLKLCKYSVSIGFA